MRILFSLLLSILIISPIVPEALNAVIPDNPLSISARINLSTTETGITSKILLNTSFPGTGWDFRVALNQAEPEVPEIFLRYNHKNFFSQFGSIHISGLLHYLENPFSVNGYEDLFSPVSVSLIPVPFTAIGDSRKYPELLFGWEIRETWLAAPVTLYAYTVPPGLNETAHYRTGVFGISHFQQQTLQIGTLLHGIQSDEKLLEDSEWYPEELQTRSDSRQGLSAGITLFRENEFAGSGIMGLVSLDSFRRSGFMAGGALYLNKEFLNLKYFQSIYSPSYPIIYPENSSSISALHTGTLLLELPKLLSISMEISEEIDSVDWNFKEEIQAERSCTTDAEVELGIAVIKIKDFLLYSYPVNGQKISVYRALNADCKLKFGALEIVMGFSAAYTDRHYVERDKSIELSFETGNVSCSYKIDFSGIVQKSRIELKFTSEELQVTVNADTTGKYQAAVVAGI
ncbi:MAG: hypothetical protein HQ557_18445 [Bacteroidetes bacterium]|nr:hypothetical protein [Bacteroidota bacterium]